jgi:hypothetical protein
VQADQKVRGLNVPTDLQTKGGAVVRVECTADLQANTLSFAWKGFDLSALTVVIPHLRDCFVDAALAVACDRFEVTLQLPG